MLTMLRPRLLIIGVLMVATALFVIELPIHTLLHQRSAIATTSSELNALNEQNQDLANTIASLRHNNVVSSIAHADYGLIFAGQQSFVVLPGKDQSVDGSANTLSTKPIPAANLVPSDVSSLSGTTDASASGSGHAAAASGPKGGIVSRTLSKLEFWRWAF